MIKAGQQRRFEMESTQEEKLNSVDVSLPFLLEGTACPEVHEELVRLYQEIPMCCVQGKMEGIAKPVEEGRSDMGFS
jgi:hypothetical protein